MGFDSCQTIEEILTVLYGQACNYHRGQHERRANCRDCVRDALERAERLGYDLGREMASTGS